MRPVLVVAEAEMAILARMVITVAREPVARSRAHRIKAVVLLAAVPALVVMEVTAVLVVMVAPL